MFWCVKQNGKQVLRWLLFFERGFQGSLNVMFDATASPSFYCLFYVLMQFIRDGNICQRNHQHKTMSFVAISVFS